MARRVPILLCVALACVALIAGPLAWIPVVLICLFGLLGLLSVTAIRRQVAEASEARADRQSFLIEMFTNFGSIKRQATEATWQKPKSHPSGACRTFSRNMRS